MNSSRTTRLVQAALISLGLLATSTVSLATSDTQPKPESQPQTEEPSAEPPDEPLKPLLNTAVLSNGLRIWHVERRASQSFVAIVTVGVGSRDESQVNNGISHLTEHVLFAGTEKWDQKELIHLWQSRGGSANAFTNRDNTSYHVELAASELETGFEWLSQVVFHPTFPEGTIERERDVVFQEKFGRYGWLINVLDSWGFGYEMQRGLLRALYPGSPLGLRVIGEDKSLDSITRADMVNWHKKFYLPNNATMVFVGGVPFERVRATAERLFGSIEKGDEISHPTRVDAQARNADIVTRGPLPVDQVREMVGYLTIPPNHADYPALRVVANYFSRLIVDDLRIDKGWVYSAYAYLWDIPNQDSIWAIRTNSEAKHLDAVFERIAVAVADARSKGLDRRRFDAAKKELIGRIALSLESNHSISFQLASLSHSPNFDPETWTPLRGIDRVTLEDAQRVVSTYFTPDRMIRARHEPLFTIYGAATIAGTVSLSTFVALALWLRARRSNQL